MIPVKSSRGTAKAAGTVQSPAKAPGHQKGEEEKVLNSRMLILEGKKKVIKPNGLVWKIKRVPAGLQRE